MTDLSQYRYAAKHAAPHNARTDREATARAETHTPRHALNTRCHRCSSGTGMACGACVAETQAGLTITRNDRNMPADVRLMPITGPQAGWQR